MNRSRFVQSLGGVRARPLVRFSTRFEDASIHGYVTAVGEQWFLLALVSDCLWFDGYECFRYSDVRGLRPDPYASFIESALKKRKERRPKNPRIRLGSIEEILRSAARSFPLVTIHRERVDPDVCQIGRVVGIRVGHLDLLEIKPDATWHDAPRQYKLREVTRVSFGGDYEEALQLVGGAAFPEVSAR